MNAKELLESLEEIVKDGGGDMKVTAGFHRINHHVNMIHNVGTSTAMSFMDNNEKKPIVVLDMCEETYNTDEDLDEVNWFYEES